MEEIKQFIRDIIEEEFSPKPIEMAAKWQGGSITLKPGNDTSSKEIPIDTFFKKVLTVRESLRVLEQKLNANKSLSDAERATLHAYITKAYGSLTSFNILFKDGKDKFVGTGSGGKPGKTDLSLSEAKAKLGMNEYTSR